MNLLSSTDLIFCLNSSKLRFSRVDIFYLILGLVLIFIKYIIIELFKVLLFIIRDNIGISNCQLTETYELNAFEH